MLKAYASYFVAYFVDNIGKDMSNVERIILFGSVARDEGTKESDIDIFIELKKKTKNTEKKIKKVLQDFYQSREAMLFKAKGIENKINIKLGKLREWEELYKSIASTGIILYGPYEIKELPSGVKQYTIVFWDKIGKNRGAFLNKIYGFKIKNKVYVGLLSKFNGKRIGKSCIMLPTQYKRDIFRLLRAYKVRAKTIEIFI